MADYQCVKFVYSKIKLYLCICTLDIFEGVGNDHRVAKRIGSSVELMISHGSAVINRLNVGYAAQKAFYRIINNKKWKMEEFCNSLYKECCRRCEGVSHVLCIQDTTELNYGSHSGRISAEDEHFGYGTWKGEKNCLFAHPTLVVDASNGLPLGFSSLKIWGRGNDSPGKKRTKWKRPLTEKESYRWAESALNTAGNISSDVCKTIVGDRENDIYEVICCTLESGCEFLIRSSSDRPTTKDGKRLSEVMDQSPVACVYELPLVGRKGRKRRTAKMELRFEQVTVLAPPDTSPDIPKEQKVWCIHTREKQESVPENEEPIEWRLLTSHEVSTVTQALACIEWYRLRWSIESLFRVVKSKGFALEDAQVETGEAMIKLIGMTFTAALHCMMLKTALEKEIENIPAKVVFTDTQLIVMKAVLPSLEPKSARYTKGRNPYPQNTLLWGAWIVAKLGGWNGRMTANDRPSHLILKRGWEQLDTISWGVEMVLKDVCKD